MASTVDFPRLAKLVKTKRKGRGLRETAQEIGDVSPSTLSRVESERLEDITVSTLLNLCDWLGISPANVIRDKGRKKPPAADLPDRVELELRESDLDERGALVLAKMFAAAYAVLREPTSSTD